MNVERVAEVAGIASMAAVLVLGAVARRAPAARRATIVGPADLTGRAAPRPLVIGSAGVAAVIALVAVGPFATMMLGALGLVVARRRQRLGQARRRADIDHAFPDSVELLVLCLHAGRSPVQAVHELARRAPSAVRPGFAAVVDRLERGAALAEALGALPATLGPCAREVASSIAAADREGLALAPVLDRLAADARTARRRQGEAAARKLPVRLAFPLVACTLPAFVLLALAPAVLGALSTLRGSAP